MRGCKSAFALVIYRDLRHQPSRRISQLHSLALSSRLPQARSRLKKMRICLSEVLQRRQTLRLGDEGAQHGAAAAARRDDEAWRQLGDAIGVMKFRALFSPLSLTAITTCCCCCCSSCPCSCSCSSSCWLLHQKVAASKTSPLTILNNTTKHQY